MAADDAWLGRVLDGRYAVEAVLGRGGMGVVLRARHKFTGALVAVKMLHSDLTRDAQLEARFLAEARASNAIGHPAIVKVLDAGRTPEGELYLVMELLVGQPMRSAVSRRLGQPAIRRITLELLDALAAAHARGFVHRDLKPENVFLADPDGAVKLLDFGIAKVLDASTKMGTQAGVVLGTVAYMAPEQLRDAAGVDARADLWALGVMIYEMLAGRLPYRGTTVEEIFVRLAREEPDPIRAWIPTVAPAVEHFMSRALARDPAARFSSSAEMAAAFVQLPLDQPHAALPARGPADSSPMATQATGIAAAAAPSVPGVPLAHAVTPRPMPMPVPPPIEPANRSRLLGVVLALAAVGVIIAAVVVARSHHDSEPHGITTDLALGSASSAAPPPPIDAAPVAAPTPPPTPPPSPTPSPSPTPPRPAPQPRPQPGTPQQPYPQQAATTDPCQASCQKAATCGMATMVACLSACHTNTLVNNCASTDCNAYSACMIAGTCGPILNGAGTCQAALNCETKCTVGDNACGCACATGMARSHALALFSLNACVLACNGNASCMAQLHCDVLANRCKAQ